MTDIKTDSNMRELIAELLHQIWSNWMRHLFDVSIENPDGSVTIPAEKVRRWKRQIQTHYIELGKAEKDSDRKQADLVYHAIIGGRSFGARTDNDSPNQFSPCPVCGQSPHWYNDDGVIMLKCDNDYCFLSDLDYISSAAWRILTQRGKQDV